MRVYRETDPELGPRGPVYFDPPAELTDQRVDNSQPQRVGLLQVHRPGKANPIVTDDQTRTACFPSL